MAGAVPAPGAGFAPGAVPAPGVGSAPGAGFTPPSWPGAPAQPGPQFTGTSGPVYGAPAGAGFGRPSPGSMLPSWGAAPKRPHFTTRAKIAVAAAAAVAVAAGVTVPLVLSHSGKSALTTSFERSLLSPAQVSSVANETFTLDTSADDNSNDNSPSGCMDSFDTIATGKDRGDASSSFVSADHTTFIEEDLSNNKVNAHAMDQLRKGINTCSSATIDGTTLSIRPLSAPQIAGSDDSLAFEMRGDVHGTTLVLVLGAARFGDNVVVMTVGGIDPSLDAQTLTNELLTAAVDNAGPALPQHHTA